MSNMLICLGTVLGTWMLPSWPRHSEINTMVIVSQSPFPKAREMFSKCFLVTLQRPVAKDSSHDFPGRAKAAILFWVCSCFMDACWCIHTCSCVEWRPEVYLGVFLNCSLFLCISLYVCMWVLKCVCRCWEGQKRVLRPLELELTGSWN